MALLLGTQVYASPPEGRAPPADPFAQGERARRMEEMRVRRAEREMLRESQREGLAPAGSDTHALRQMNAEERRRFRRELNEAARQIYRDGR